MTPIFRRAAIGCALVAALALASAAQAAPETLVSSTRSSSVTPSKGQTAKLIIAGTGSVILTIVYSYDEGVNFYPKVAAVDASAPIRMDRVTYNGATLNGEIHEFSDNVTGYRVAVLPETVTGTVTVDWR